MVLKVIYIWCIDDTLRWSSCVGVVDGAGDAPGVLSGVVVVSNTTLLDLLRRLELGSVAWVSCVMASQSGDGWRQKTLETLGLFIAVFHLIFLTALVASGGEI